MSNFLFLKVIIIRPTLYVINLSLQSYKSTVSIGGEFVCYDFRTTLNSELQYLQKIKIAHNFGSGKYFLMKLSGCGHSA